MKVDKMKEQEEKLIINGLSQLVNPQVALPERDNCVVENRVYILNYIEDDYRWQVLLPLNEYLVKREKSDTKPLQFFIDSGGGEVTLAWATLALISMAKKKKIPVETYVLGRASSAASEIAIAGDVRYMYESSYHGIHFGCELAYNVQNKHGIETNKQRMEQNFEDSLAHYIKHTNADPQQLENWLKEEITYLNSKQCKKWGFVDKIIKGL